MAGRPKRVFSEHEVNEIDRLARINCNTNTIATALDIPFNSLERHFGKKLKQGRALHKADLRESQDNLKDTPPMAIWLGKQDLGQTDKQIIQTEKIDKPKSAKDLQAAKAAAKAYNAVQSREPTILPITGQKEA